MARVWSAVAIATAFAHDPVPRHVKLFSKRKRKLRFSTPNGPSLECGSDSYRFRPLSSAAPMSNSSPNESGSYASALQMARVWSAVAIATAFAHYPVPRHVKLFSKRKRKLRFSTPNGHPVRFDRCVSNRVPRARVARPRAHNRRTN